MIQLLDHRKINQSKQIRAVFQASYAIEARLLKAVDFPPLRRTLDGFVSSHNQFLGYFREKELAGVVEIDQKDHGTHIQSLVVHPDFFRQGIGLKLMEYVMETFDAKLFTVETGVDNGPACALYLKLGFVEVKQYDTDVGIRKVCFERGAEARG